MRKATRASRAAVLGAGAVALSLLVSGCDMPYKAGDAGCVGYTKGYSYLGCMNSQQRRQQLADERLQLQQQQAATAQNQGARVTAHDTRFVTHGS